MPVAGCHYTYLVDDRVVDYGVGLVEFRRSSTTAVESGASEACGHMRRADGQPDAQQAMENVPLLPP